MPFKNFINYLVLEKKYSSHTVIAYKNDLEKFYEFAATEFDYSEITTIHYSIIRSWIVKLVDDGLSLSLIHI